MSVAVQDPHAVALTPAPPPPSWRRSLATLVRRGVRDSRRAPLTWGGGLGLMSGLMAAIWPSFEDSVDQIFENYPAALKDAFNIQELDSVEKYIDAEMLSLIVPLALAFFAVRCATRATVGAEDRGHLDTLLSLPVSRRVLVASALIVSALMVLAILGVTWVLTMIAGALAGTGISAGTMAVGLLNVWPLSMAFAGLAVLVAGLAHRPVTVTEIAAGTLVAMYVIDLAGKLSDTVEPLREITAFRYYGSAVQNGFDISHALGLTLVGVVLAAIGTVLFERRDVL